MSDNSRTSNSIKNSTYGLLSYAVINLLSFVARSVLINTLSNQYAGINGLFSNIISMISLTELGIGVAIVFSLYKPLAEDNKEAIKSILNLYKNCYRIIAGIVALMGFVLFFTFQYLIKDYQQSGITLNYLRVIFVIYIVDALSSYLLSYKKCLLLADQKKYFVTNSHTIAKVASTIIQIIVLVLTKNFILYTLLMLLSNLSENIICIIFANKKYPYIKEKNVLKVEKSEKQGIIKNIKAMFLHKIGGFAVFSTSNLMVSAFLGLEASGSYVSYSMITNALKTSLEQVDTAVTAGYGNLLALDNKKRTFEVFQVSFFLAFWLYSFCSITLMVIFQPFISLWVGKSSLLPLEAVFLMSLFFYITGMRSPAQTVKDAAGLFNNDKYTPLIEAVINLGISFLLAPKFGVSGILLSMVITTILVPFWVKPYITFKHVFGGGLKKYFARYALYFVITLGLGALTYFLAEQLTFNSVMITLFAKLCVCLIVPNFLIIVFFCRTAPFKELMSILCRHKMLRPVFGVFLKSSDK